MMALSPEQKARLPQYAQSELVRLEREVAYWHDKATEGPRDTDVWLSHGFRDDDRPLPRHSQVRFTFDEKRRLYIEAQKSDDGGVSVRGSDMVNVEPAASNVLTVRLRR